MSTKRTYVVVTHDPVIKKTPSPSTMLSPTIEVVEYITKRVEDCTTMEVVPVNDHGPATTGDLLLISEDIHGDRYTKAAFAMGTWRRCVEETKP